MEQALLQYMYRCWKQALLGPAATKKRYLHENWGGQLQADRLLQPQMFTDR
jgi:hypothetical protein